LGQTYDSHGTFPQRAEQEVKMEPLQSLGKELKALLEASRQLDPETKKKKEREYFLCSLDEQITEAVKASLADLPKVLRREAELGFNWHDVVLATIPVFR